MREYRRDGNAEGRTQGKVDILRGSRGREQLIKENEKELVEEWIVKSWKPKDQRRKKTREFKCHKLQFRKVCIESRALSAQATGHLYEINVSSPGQAVSDRWCSDIFWVKNAG